MSIYFKQCKLYNPDKDGQPRIHVYGVGSIGSHVVAGLSKSGFQDITIHDYDDLEDDNLPAQFYPYERVKEEDESKTRILKEFIHGFTGTTIDIINGKIDLNSALDPTLNGIHIVCFDNIEGRKAILSLLEGMPVYLIDGRIGGFNYEKYSMRLDESKKVDYYKETLEGEFSQLECGEKTLWSINSMIASLIVGDVIKISKSQDTTLMVKGNLMGNHTIVKEDI